MGLFLSFDQRHHTVLSSFSFIRGFPAHKTANHNHNLISAKGDENCKNVKTEKKLRLTSIFASSQGSLSVGGDDGSRLRIDR